MTNEVVDLAAIATLISFFVPLVVSLITKETASAGLKAVVSAIGAAVAAVLALWINPSDVEITWELIVNTFLASLVISGGAYQFLWKPVHATGAIDSATQGFGLGGTKEDYTEAA